MENKIIYIYTTPSMKKEGYVKIGETTLRKDNNGNLLNEEDSVKKRIEEQHYTAGTFNKENKFNQFEILFFENSYIKETNSYFSDKDIHKILNDYGLKCWKDNSFYIDNNGKKIEKVKTTTEIYKISINIVKNIFYKLKNNEDITEQDLQIKRLPLMLKDEQSKVIEETKQYFINEREQFPKSTINYLWFLKMGFGKTISSYQFIKEMNFDKNIIITYVPSVEDGWKEDIRKFQGFEDYIFISSTQKDNKDKKYIEKQIKQGKKVVFFLSFQKINSDNKKEQKNNEEYLKGIFELNWDLLIKEEYHYGVHNDKSKDITSNIEDEDIFNEEENKLAQSIIKQENKIKTNNILCLSGTPFNVLKSGEFTDKQVSKFDYIEEQKLKEQKLKDLSQEDKEKSIYYKIPKMKMFNFDLKDTISKYTEQGKNEFSISYFFKAENNEFIGNNKTLIQYFIKGLYKDIEQQIYKKKEELDDLIFNNETVKEQELETELSCNIFNIDNTNIDNTYTQHTLWLLPSIESCYALEKVLKEEEYFKDFEILNVNKKEYGSGVSVVNKVKEQIEESETQNKRTITLSLQKLGVGVNVPQWGSVIFLNDMKSEQSYFQYAFRCQRGYNYPKYDNNGNFIGTKTKTECYVFDFNYLRSFQMYEGFNINASSNENKQEETMEDLTHYLPILSIEKDSKIIEMSIEDIFNRIEQSYSLLSGTEYQQKFNKSLVFNHNVKDIFKNKEDLLSLINCIKIEKDIKRIKDNEISDKEQKLIDKLKTKKNKTQKEQSDEDKIIEKQKNLIVEKLKIIYSRIPLSIYLSKTKEIDLYSVVDNFNEQQFEIIFKMTKENFKDIVEITNLDIQEINRFIRQFHKLEHNNFDISEIEIL